MHFCFAGGVEAILAARALLKHTIKDEIYLMQEAQYSGESHIGVNDKGDHYRGVEASMINGVKETVPIVFWI